MGDYRLSDYERGYRAAQRRALRLADVAFDTEGAAEAWEETVKAMKIELAMPIPPDPHTLVQS